MKVGSTFSGVGGLDLGLERAGMEVVWQAENDDWCRRVLKSHWPEIKTYSDVKEINDSAQPVEFLVGGFPCQDLSLAGKRAGIEGEKSVLFFEFARISRELRPEWFLIENVGGMLSSANGRDFGIVLSKMAEIGYGISWRILDAQYFGVPQRRRRVFIVGNLRKDGCKRAVRALGAGGEGDLEAGACSWQGVASWFGEGVTGSRGEWPSRITPTLNAAFGDKQGLENQHALNGAGLFVRTDPIAKTLTTRNQRNNPENETFVIASALDTQRGGPDDNSAQANHIVAHLAGVRRLTPTECERLMSWPDGWTNIDGDNTPDGRRYKACGNGVVSNVSEWIGSRIMAIEKESIAEDPYDQTL